MYPGYPDANHNGYTPFQVKLPFTKAESITLHRLGGAPTDNNIHSEKVTHEQEVIAANTLSAEGQFAINAATGGTAEGMPPAEVFMYVFKGTDIGAAGKELSLKEVRDLQPHSFQSN